MEIKSYFYIYKMEFNKPFIHKDNFFFKFRRSKISSNNVYWKKLYFSCYFWSLVLSIMDKLSPNMASRRLISSAYLTAKAL